MQVKVKNDLSEQRAIDSKLVDTFAPDYIKPTTRQSQGISITNNMHTNPKRANSQCVISSLATHFSTDSLQSLDRIQGERRYGDPLR